MANFHEVMDMNAKSTPKRKGGESEHKLKRVEHERSSNGGHVFTHHAHNSGMSSFKEPETHTFGKEEGKEALKHFAEHAGLSEHLKGIEKKQEGEAGAEHADDDEEEGGEAAI